MYSASERLQDYSQDVLSGRGYFGVFLDIFFRYSTFNSPTKHYLYIIVFALVRGKIKQTPISYQSQPKIFVRGNSQECENFYKPISNSFCMA